MNIGKFKGHAPVMAALNSMSWLRILNPKSWDLVSRLKGYWICVTKGNFFQERFEFQMKIWEISWRLIWPSAWFYKFNLRLRRYSICSASTSRTIYERRFEAWAPHSLHAAKKVLRRLLEALDGLTYDMMNSKSSRSIRRCLQKYSMPARLDYEELGGLSDPGPRDCL